MQTVEQVAVGSELQYISVHRDFVFRIIWFKKHLSFISSSWTSQCNFSVTFSHNYHVPESTQLYQAFPRHSGVFNLSSSSATLPEQSDVPPTSSWIPSASPKLWNNALCVYVSVPVHTLRVKVSSTVADVNIYHSVTSPLSHSALIITAEADHLSRWR